MDPTEHRGDASRLVDLLLRSCSLQPMDGLLLRLQFDVDFHEVDERLPSGDLGAELDAWHLQLNTPRLSAAAAELPAEA